MQAIRRWLDRLFNWLLRKEEAKAELTAARDALRRRSAQEQAAWQSRNGLSSSPGAAPRLRGQSDAGFASWDERPERISQPAPLAGENHDIPMTSLPTTPPVETIVQPPQPAQAEATIDTHVPSTPAADQQLIFLRFLVKRGVVNEGFPQDETPEQYKI